MADRRPSGDRSCPTSHAATAVARAVVVAVATGLPVVGQAVAHSGHADGHKAGGSMVVPGTLLLGGLLVIGAGAYLDHAGRIDGRLARLAVLLGIGAVLVGVLTAV